MNKKVTAERFCKTFSKLWDIEKINNPKKILSLYNRDLTWTEYMLTKEGSFLKKISKQLSLKMDREWYGILDCVYYEDEPNLYDGGTYPACLHVYIEHENQDAVEEEMWKMLMFRSPLKVLIFYDYWEDDKGTEKKNNWLQDKFTRLLDMGEMVDVRWPEADNTEYLFLVGNKEDRGQLPRWRYLTVRAGHFGEVRKPVSLNSL